MLIDGKMMETAEKISVKNPYNKEEVGVVSACTHEDVKKAVASAKKAKKVAKAFTPYQRYELIYSIYEQVKERKEELAKLITAENGKTIRCSRNEIDRSLITFLTAAEEAKRINGELLPCDVTSSVTGKKALVLREPIGTVAAIAPFNYPMNLVAHKIAPAIAAGNTIVLKPATSTPLTAYELGKIVVEAGAPAGMMNVVSGSGKEVGGALVESDVDMISFTGSVEVGKNIAAHAGFKKLSLEMGGNGPLIITEDANIKNAVDAAVDGAFGTAGQRCTAVKRIILDNKVADDFIQQFVAKTEKLVVGDPMSEKTYLGPLIDEKSAVNVEERVKDAIANGAELLTGGKREGALYWPTVLDKVPHNVNLVATETFGPTAPIIRCDGLQEAVEIANETPYGLQAGIFTDSLQTMKYAINQIESGAVIINGQPGFRIETLPFGGVKNSGLGREGVKYAIQEMTELKTVVF